MCAGLDRIIRMEASNSRRLRSQSFSGDRILLASGTESRRNSVLFQNQNKRAQLGEWVCSFSRTNRIFALDMTTGPSARLTCNPAPFPGRGSSPQYGKLVKSQVCETPRSIHDPTDDKGPSVRGCRALRRPLRCLRRRIQFRAPSVVNFGEMLFLSVSQSEELLRLEGR